MHAQLQKFARAQIGSHSVEWETPWGRRGSYIAAMHADNGKRWYIKVLPDRERFRSELTAYLRWTPQLEGRAPTLRGYDAELGALAISAAPGELAMSTANDPLVFWDAGRVLRHLHSADALASANVGERKVAELDRLVWQAALILDWHTLERARAIVRELEALGEQSQVPCHHDYSPRNWLVHKGTVHVIDFEWASFDVWVADLVRLHFGWWWRDQEELEEAFHDGYGRWPTEEDHALLRGCAIVNALRCTVVARLRGDEPFERSSIERLVELTA